MSDDGIDREALLRIFLAEAEENLATMEESLLALEKSPDDGALIQAIFRAAHTLKGNCATVGLDTLVALTHAAEDLLDSLRSRRFPATNELITLLLRSTDSLKGLIPLATTRPDEPPVPDEALVAALKQAAQSGKYAAPATSIGAAPAIPPTAAATSVRVQTRKLDVLLSAASELNIVRGRVRVLCESTDSQRAEGEIADALDDLDRLTDHIQELVLQTRMVPIGPVLRQQVRTARDLAARVGKQVAVRISGEDVELDTSVIERLRDPLTHMIRNAVDHGIETPDVREANGKDPEGTISLHASHREGMIVVEVADDGAGIDPARLRERAQSMRLDASISDRDLLRMILLPGFSTASRVTEVSGRGIGLDVVEKNISAVGGSIAIDSEPGRGTTFTIRLPLTVAVLHGLSTRVGEELYIIPLPTVSECLDMPAEASAGAHASGVFTLRGEALPFLRLRRHFQTPGECGTTEKLVVVEYDRKRAALVVDDFIGETRAVVKPMSRLFRHSGWISGSALLGSGDIGLVLEVASILEDAASHSHAEPSTGKELT